jgi:ring-1,2-phenylacetyl-CoA epoxidase subunit PaaE
MAEMFHDLTINKIIRETPDAVTLQFAVPEDLKQAFKYQPGQYLTLSFTFGNKEERRAYSMSSSPLDENIAVTVKKLEGGIVSSYIHDQLREGAVVSVMPPEGKFIPKINEDHRKSYYFFGAGSGITPLISIIKTLLEKEPQSSIFLLYGSRDEQHIIFRDALEGLQGKYSGQLKVSYVLSQPERQKPEGLKGWFSKGTTNWEGRIGRIDGKLVDLFLEENQSIYEDSEYFICGPGGMIESVQAQLKTMEIDAKKIHVEHFFIEHEGEGKGLNEASVEITLNGKKYLIEVPETKTILDVMIEDDLNPPYSCTSGACSTCMAKVLEGEVTMEVSHALDEDEIKNGYILTCQAHPQTPKTVITFDE